MTRKWRRLKTKDQEAAWLEARQCYLSRMTQPPEFKSNIPDHLLEGAKPSEKHILNLLSKLEQQQNWFQCEFISHVNNREIDDRITALEERLKPLEKWQTMLLNRYTLVPILFSVIVGLKFLYDLIPKK